MKSVHAAQRLSVPGPVGTLEAIWLPPVSPTSQAAVVCHPLPTGGGTMHNKVVHTLAQVFAGFGMGVMRFNTRGTGNSEGTFDNGIGETADLASVVKWLVTRQGCTHLWLAGFSFGSYIAFHLSITHRQYAALVQHLVLVGPPVARFPFGTDKLPDCPVSILQGDADEIVDPDQVFAWAEKLQAQRTEVRLLQFADCSHFFHGRLIDLRTRLTDQLGTIHPALLPGNL